MGRVIDLAWWRHEHRAQPGRPHGTTRLEDAVVRLDPLVAHLSASGRRIDAKIETELLAITGAVSIGLVEEAAARAERLADRLEHPAMHARR